MRDENRKKQNQRTTGKGKKETHDSREANNSSERSQVQRIYPEGDYGAIAREEASRQGDDERKDNSGSRKGAQ